MTDEKWNSLIGDIVEKFGAEEKINEELEDGRTIEGVIFEGPAGRMKIERVTAPLVIDKKTTYSNRIGSHTTVDYVYSETETVQKIFVYRWNAAVNDWEKIEGLRGDFQF